MEPITEPAAPPAQPEAPAQPPAPPAQPEAPAQPPAPKGPPCPTDADYDWGKHPGAGK